MFRKVSAPSRQATALHQLHAKEMVPLVSPNLIDGNNVGMIKTRRRLGFSMKSCNVSLRSKFPGKDHLQSDKSIQADLACLVNHTHAASAEFTQQLVVTERAAGKLHWRSGNSRLRWCHNFVQMIRGIEVSLQFLGKIRMFCKQNSLVYWLASL